MSKNIIVTPMSNFKNRKILLPEKLSAFLFQFIRNATFIYDSNKHRIYGRFCLFHFLPFQSE